jgi:hypothetical protein
MAINPIKTRNYQALGFAHINNKFIGNGASYLTNQFTNTLSPVNMVSSLQGVAPASFPDANVRCMTINDILYAYRKVALSETWI